MIGGRYQRGTLPFERLNLQIGLIDALFGFPAT